MEPYVRLDQRGCELLDTCSRFNGEFLNAGRKKRRLRLQFFDGSQQSLEVKDESRLKKLEGFEEWALREDFALGLPTIRSFAGKRQRLGLVAPLESSSEAAAGR